MKQMKCRKPKIGNKKTSEFFPESRIIKRMKVGEPDIGRENRE